MVVRCGSPTVTPGGKGPPPLSVKTIAGAVLPTVVQPPARLRLLVSAVEPAKLDPQLGALVVPFTVATRSVREAVVVPVKNVSVAQQSPTRLYSTPVHPEARLAMLALLCEPSVPLTSDAVTMSLPPWVWPTMWRLPRSDKGTAGKLLAGVFR